MFPVCWLVAISPGRLIGQAPHAEVSFQSFQPNLGGDVVLFVATRDMPGRFDLEAAARRLLRCDWTNGTGGGNYAGGICRALLKSDGGNLDEWLQLAPLVLALRSAGAVRVELRVTLYFWPGQRLETLGAWKDIR